MGDQEENFYRKKKMLLVLLSSCLFSTKSHQSQYNVLVNLHPLPYLEAPYLDAYAKAKFLGLSADDSELVDRPGFYALNDVAFDFDNVNWNFSYLLKKQEIDANKFLPNVSATVVNGSEVRDAEGNVVGKTIDASAFELSVSTSGSSKQVVLEQKAFEKKGVKPFLKANVWTEEGLRPIPQTFERRL